MKLENAINPFGNRRAGQTVRGGKLAMQHVAV